MITRTMKSCSTKDSEYTEMNELKAKAPEIITLFYLTARRAMFFTRKYLCMYVHYELNS